MNLKKWGTHKVRNLLKDKNLKGLENRKIFFTYVTLFYIIQWTIDLSATIIAFIFLMVSDGCLTKIIGFL